MPGGKETCLVPAPFWSITGGRLPSVLKPVSLPASSQMRLSPVSWGDTQMCKVVEASWPGIFLGDREKGRAPDSSQGRKGAAAIQKSARPQRNVCCWPEPKDGALQPQRIVFMKAAIKGKWGLLRKLEGM